MDLRDGPDRSRAFATHLINTHGRDLRYCRELNTWLTWNGRRWERNLDAGAKKRAKDAARRLWPLLREQIPRLTPKDVESCQTFCSKAGSYAGILATLNVARDLPGIPVCLMQLDPDPYLFNVANGTIDLRTGKLRRHRRKDLITRLSPTTFDRRATCPRFRRLLDDVFDGNTGVIDYLQRFLGYCLSGDVSEHVVGVWQGDGGNGKSTLTDAIQHVIGQNYFGVNDTEVLPSPEGRLLISFHGRRLVVMNHCMERKPLYPELLRLLSGAVMLQDRDCDNKSYDFLPTHKAIIAGSDLPGFGRHYDPADGTLHLLNFPATFDDDRKAIAAGAKPIDPRLGEKLKGEASGILNWLVQGFLKYQETGLRPPLEVLAR